MHVSCVCENMGNFNWQSRFVRIKYNKKSKREVSEGLYTMRYGLRDYSFSSYLKVAAPDAAFWGKQDFWHSDNLTKTKDGK